MGEFEDDDDDDDVDHEGEEKMENESGNDDKIMEEEADNEQIEKNDDNKRFNSQTEAHSWLCVTEEPRVINESPFWIARMLSLGSISSIGY